MTAPVALAVLALAGLLLYIVFKRVAKRAERASKERAAAKWGKTVEEPDTRKAWAGEASGENPKGETP